ncbi:MAG: hypothetical protein IJY10_02900 [Lachnospiraceae bacterium]|nr:hypothetical protein [Lachnospiraceae bacterium]
MSKDSKAFIVMDERNGKRRLIEAGKKRFDFNKEQELLKYKYINFENMTPKEWRQCQKCIACKGMPYNYPGWRAGIREKYIGYSLTELVDFRRYLIQCARKRKCIFSPRKRHIEQNFFVDFGKVIEDLIALKKR